jgi:hypothetical protein
LNWIWKSKCVPTIIFFAWLLLNDRLNTRNILRRRKKFLENYNYVMCQCNVEETLEHLFFDCSCAATRWFSLGIVWNDEAQVNHKIMRQDCFPLPFFHGDLHGGYLVHLEWEECSHFQWKGTCLPGRTASSKRSHFIYIELSPIYTLLSEYGLTAYNL